MKRGPVARAAAGWQALGHRGKKQIGSAWDVSRVHREVDVADIAAAECDGLVAARVIARATSGDIPQAVGQWLGVVAAGIRGGGECG